MTLDCENGAHADLVADEPEDLGGCVNIEWRCPACGTRVRVVSWGKDDWVAEQAKLAKKAVKREKSG